MSMPATSRRVIVIDDNPEIHADFKSILSPAPTAARSSNLDELRAAVLGGNKPVVTVPKNASARFRVDSAFQGEDGFKMICAAAEGGEPYSVAFVDMRMPPGWDGLQTIKEIWDVEKELQIVICTAFSDHPWDVLDELADKSDRLLILKKPFDAVEVKRLTNTLSAKWRLNRAALARAQEFEAILAEHSALTKSADQEMQHRINGLHSVVRELTEQLENAGMKPAKRLTELAEDEEPSRFSLSEGAALPTQL